MPDEKYVELNLPSKLLPYKKLGISKVETRFLKGKDEKFIGEFTIANFEKKFSELMKGTIRGINPDELTIGDRIYITMWYAINCYSYIYPEDSDCEHCFNPIVEIDLRDLEKVELPEDFIEPYSLKLPQSGDTINLRLLRVKDQIAYMDNTTSSGKEDLMYKIALTMEDDRNLLEKREYLRELSTIDLGFIKSFYEKYYHGVKMEGKYKCPKCGGTGIAPVQFRLDLLVPSGNNVVRSVNNVF